MGAPGVFYYANLCTVGMGTIGVGAHNGEGNRVRRAESLCRAYRLQSRQQSS